MLPYRTMFLRFSLLLVGLSSCRSDYSMLKPSTEAHNDCIEKFTPKGITTSWYDASVDVYGKHISGLLLIKQFPADAYRTVFMNEAGVTYFDFAWEGNGIFTPHHIIQQLDKGPVIQTLRKDFELILGIPFRQGTPAVFQADNLVYFGVPQKKETAYFITGEDCASLQALELGSRRKQKVSVKLYGNSLQRPDSVTLQHHTFDMRISLKRIEKE